MRERERYGEREGKKESEREKIKTVLEDGNCVFMEQNVEMSAYFGRESERVLKRIAN